MEVIAENPVDEAFCFFPMAAMGHCADGLVGIGAAEEAGRQPLVEGDRTLLSVDGEADQRQRREQQADNGEGKERQDHAMNTSTDSRR